MRNLTEKAIKEAFIKLLNERPLSQISVKDIVTECGINRNTFYYHFSDIPTLVQRIVTDEANSLIEQYPTIDSIEQCLEVALKFAMENKKAVLHIHNSANRDIYEHYVMNVCKYVVTSYIGVLSEGRDINEEDKRLIIHLFQCECFGIIIEWLDNGMKNNIFDDFYRLCELRKGLVEELIKRTYLAQIEQKEPNA